MVKNYSQNKVKAHKVCYRLNGNTLIILAISFVFYRLYFYEFDSLDSFKKLNTQTDIMEAQFMSVNSSYALIVITLLMFFLLAIISYKLIVSLKYKKKLIDLFGAQTRSLENLNVTPQKNHSNDYLYFGMFTHDIKGALSAMGRMSNELSLKINEGDYEKSKILINELDTGIQFLNHHVKHYLIWLLSKNNLIVEDEVVNINDFILDIAQTAKAIYFKNNNELTLSLVDDNTQITTKPLLLKVVLLNIIDNAFKHTMNDSVNIKVEKCDNQLVISCIDSGKGMNQEHLTELGGFTFYNSQNNVDSFGMGYRIVYDLIDVLKGEIEIDSKLNIGTTVKVKLLNA